MLIATGSRVHTADPLDESYFTTAASTLAVHGHALDHRCTGCGEAWPCQKTLAAAFMLEMHGADPVAA